MKRKFEVERERHRKPSGEESIRRKYVLKGAGGDKRR